MTETNNDPRKYSVLVYSKEFDTEAFDYSDLDEAIEAMGRLVLAGIKQRDGVERWYRAVPTDEVKEE